MGFHAALFQSLLFEACGRTINPVNGAVGLLWSGNWQLCQTAVETVLRGGTLRPLPQDDDPQTDSFYESSKRHLTSSPKSYPSAVTPSNLDLRLSGEIDDRRLQKRPGTPSEESGTTCAESGEDWTPEQAPILLNLFAWGENTRDWFTASLSDEFEKVKAMVLDSETKRFPEAGDELGCGFCNPASIYTPPHRSFFFCIPFFRLLMLCGRTDQ